MNKLVIVSVLLFSLNSIAKEPVCTESVGQAEEKEKLEINTDVPKHLKGAVIIVRQADGKESSVPAEKFKVVPRKQQFIVTKLETKSVKSCVTNEASKNRVSVLAGYGARNGLSTSQNGSTVTVESKTGANAGAQYQRLLNDRISVGVQGQSNKTGSVLLGLDF